MGETTWMETIRSNWLIFWNPIHSPLMGETTWMETLTLWDNNTDCTARLSLNGGNYLNGNFYWKMDDKECYNTLSLNGGNYLNGNIYTIKIWGVFAGINFNSPLMGETTWMETLAFYSQDQLKRVRLVKKLSLNGGNYLNGNGIILTAVNCPVVDKLSLNGGNYLNGNIISNVKYFEKVFWSKKKDPVFGACVFSPPIGKNTWMETILFKIDSIIFFLL